MYYVNARGVDELMINVYYYLIRYVSAYSPVFISSYIKDNVR